MQDIIKTKWGIAKLNSEGYYQITSGKEKNRGKLLHRLIAADYFGDWIDDPNEPFDIHHICGDKTNNCVLNLEPIPHDEHISLHKTGEKNHNYGKPLPLETRKKISEGNKGKIRSNKTRKKISANHADVSGENNPNWKNYARIVKVGFNREKQVYCIIFNGKRIKYSICPDKLKEWFLKEYSLEIIKI